MSDSRGERPVRILRLLVILTAIAFVLLLPVVVFLVNNRPPRISVYTPKLPKPNGWDDFVAAGKLIDRKNPSPYSAVNKPLNSWTIPEYQTFIRGNAPAVARLRLGLTRPYLHPPERSIYDPSLGFYASFREMARVLTGEALYYQATGQPGEAMRCNLDAVEMGVTLPRGGPIFAGLVGCAIESIGMKDVDQILQRLSREELAQVAQRLERIQLKRVPYSDMILEEGRAHTAMDAKLYKNPDTVKGLADPRTWRDQIGSGWWDGARLAFTNKNRMIYDNDFYYRKLAAEQRSSYTGKSAVPLPRNLVAEAGLLDRLAEVRERFTAGEARLTLLQVEVALFRYRCDHARYPSRLHELVPAYLKSTPIDPFGLGKPPVYRPLNNGREFLLYSLGQHLKDDGGRPCKWKRGDADGDLVLGKGKD